MVSQGKTTAKGANTMTSTNACVIAYEGPSDTDGAEEIYSCAVCGVKWQISRYDAGDALPCAGLPTGTYAVG